MLTPGERDQMRADQVAFMFDSVEIDRLGDPVWSDEEQATVPSVTPIYRVDGGPGPARVALPHGTPIVTESGQLVTPQTALVTIPYGPTPAPGDRVRILAPRPGLPEYVWVQALEVPGPEATACRMACGVQS